MVHVDHLLKINKENKKLKKQGIREIFIKINLMKPAFNMTVLMQI